MSYLKCPNCRVQYPVERLYRHPHDRPASGKRYTVCCLVCGHQFDVSFSKRWFLPLRAIIQR